MDRTELLREESEKLIKDRCAGSIRLAIGELEDRLDEICGSLKEALEELFLKAADMQKRGSRGEISCMGISYCLSGILTGNYGLRLELYDRELYLDREECCVIWDPEFATVRLQEDIGWYSREIRRRVPRVKTYELQEYAVKCMDCYMCLLWKVLRQLLPLLSGEVSAAGCICRGGGIEAFFGEYMGRCARLCGGNGNELFSTGL